MRPILLFDADGVMTLPEEYFSIVYARSHGLDPATFENFFKTDWADFVTGKKDLKEHISNNPEFWQWNSDADELLKYWFEIENIQNIELIDLIKDYRSRGIKCYLATEQEKYRGEYMKNIMFPELFDGYFITAELGVKKDNPEFFIKIIDHLKLSEARIEPSDVFFFDDSQSKVDAANAVGINGILYKNLESVKEVI
jgi:putative hydrolase of the HAD superfamily